MVGAITTAGGSALGLEGALLQNQAAGPPPVIPLKESVPMALGGIGAGVVLAGKGIDKDEKLKQGNCPNCGSSRNHEEEETKEKKN